MPVRRRCPHAAVHCTSLWGGTNPVSFRVHAFTHPPANLIPCNGSMPTELINQVEMAARAGPGARQELDRSAESPEVAKQQWEAAEAESEAPAATGRPSAGGEGLGFEGFRVDAAPSRAAGMGNEGTAAWVWLTSEAGRSTRVPAPSSSAAAGGAGGPVLTPVLPVSTPQPARQQAWPCHFLGSCAAGMRAACWMRLCCTQPGAGTAWRREPRRRQP
jgi:hypothetical protein